MILDVTFEDQTEVFDTSFKEHSQPTPTKFNETSQLLNSKLSENTELFDFELDENVKYFVSDFGEIYRVGTEDDTPMYLLVTEDGQEIPAVMVEELTMFDATPNDIRIGKTAATNEGVTIGEKVIPTYHTHEGTKIVTPGKQFLIGGEHYNYTKLQAMVCSYNTNLSNSVATEKVAINNKIYNVLSIESIAAITTEDAIQRINFGIVNETAKPQILRYIDYKEIE